MSKVKYSLNGASFPVKPEIIGAHIQKLMDKNGGEVTAEDVLKSAKSKRSKIHTCFEWDDTKAAHQYRLRQARDLVRSVSVIIEDGDKKVETRAFVKLSVDDDGNLTHNPFKNKNNRYVSVQSVMESNPLKKYTLETALLEMDRFRKKYENLKEFARVFEELDKLKEKAEAAV